MRDERERPELGETWVDNLWRGLGWGMFFGLGYFGTTRAVDVHWMYPLACTYIAERKLATELLLKYGSLVLQWLIRRALP